MTPERLRQIEELYHAACERPGQEREAFLTDSCGSDEELRQHVQALLTHDSTVPVQIPVVEAAGHPLSGPPSGGWPPGTMLGAYQIRGRLGEGGMGDVYKAHDTRLGREVAIKTAKQEFSGRFQREARAISSLNHPNICTLYDVGPDYLVMELIEGKPIAGPLPVEEAVRLATQIASAVRHAHQHGVIHRDLKPGNILVTKAGVKVLDFGLAKFDRLRENAPEATLTEKGMILGTLRYMAPEQLKGLEAGQRSDIFAFGVVFYELLTGRPPFEGQSQADLIASVLTSDVVPLASLLPGIPMQLDHLVRTCLVKDPGERYQAMHDVLLELQWMAASGSQPGEVRATAKRWRRREILAWSAAASMAAAGGFLYFRQTSATPPASHFPVRFEQPVPPSSFLWSDMPAVSPDGRSFAYALGLNSILWLRRLDQPQPTPLTRTEAALLPFWSPDSRFIAYVSRDQLKTVSAAGGTPQVVCLVPVLERFNGGTWSPHGFIVYGTDKGLYRVQATGGEPKPVLALDKTRGETRQTWPHFLPDGRRFLYTSLGGERPGVYLGSIDSQETTRILDHASNVNWVSPGLLLFGRGRTLLAQPFDADTGKLSGTPFRVSDPVARFASKTVFSSSPNGTLVYVTESAVVLLPTWYDRNGKRLGSVGSPYLYWQVTLSPDEKVLAAHVMDPKDRKSDIWLLDLASGILSRQTSDSSSKDTAVWSPDGREILFSSNRSGVMQLYNKPVGGGEDRLVYGSTQSVYPGEWLRDGSFLFLNDNGLSFLRLHPGNGAKVETLLKTDYSKDGPHVSPDGNWVVYNTDESGRWEVYLATFPAFTGRRQISANGGVQGVWRKDGRELFYLSLEGELLSVPIKPGLSPEPGVPKVLFRTRIPVAAQLDQFAATADGQRFLVLESQEGASRPLTVVVDWQAEMMTKSVANRPAP